MEHKIENKVWINETSIFFGIEKEYFGLHLLEANNWINTRVNCWTVGEHKIGGWKMQSVLYYFATRGPGVSQHPHSLYFCITFL